MIYTSNFVVLGTISNFPALYTNSMTAPGLSNIQIYSGLDVTGDVHTRGRMDVGDTIFATFRPSSNISFSNRSEIVAKSNEITMDMTSTDMSAMSNVPMVIQPYQVFNRTTGIVTVPTTGIYTLSMQGSFSNDANASNIKNGVYYRFLNHSYSNSRVAGNITSGPLVSTSTVKFLLGGDTFTPVFYSNDSNATLLGGTGETFMSFSVMATVTPTHSNYFRT